MFEEDSPNDFPNFLIEMILHHVNSQICHCICSKHAKAKSKLLGLLSFKIQYLS